jgi:ubiquinone/menaquinone biosynthesis C-methylase UbiE
MSKLCARGKLADVGCGDKPYKNMAKEYIDEHVGIDHEDTFHGKVQIDLAGTAYSLPVKDETSDGILCTYVLEDLEQPDRAIAEANRILKKRRGVWYLYGSLFLAHS